LFKEAFILPAPAKLYTSYSRDKGPLKNGDYISVAQMKERRGGENLLLIHKSYKFPPPPARLHAESHAIAQKLQSLTLGGGASYIL
jgi:hypothetical protein